MSEIDYYLHRKLWEPEPRTENVPEDALTVRHVPCAMGTASCETQMQPIDTKCACGFFTYHPKIGYRLADLDEPGRWGD